MGSQMKPKVSSMGAESSQCVCWHCWPELSVCITFSHHLMCSNFHLVFRSRSNECSERKWSLAVLRCGCKSVFLCYCAELGSFGHFGGVPCIPFTLDVIDSWDILFCIKKEEEERKRTNVVKLLGAYLASCLRLMSLTLGIYFSIYKKKKKKEKEQMTSSFFFWLPQNVQGSYTFPPITWLVSPVGVQLQVMLCNPPSQCPIVYPSSLASKKPPSSPPDSAPPFPSLQSPSSLFPKLMTLLLNALKTRVPGLWRHMLSRLPGTVLAPDLGVLKWRGVESDGTVWFWLGLHSWTEQTFLWLFHQTVQLFVGSSCCSTFENKSTILSKGETPCVQIWQVSTVQVKLVLSWTQQQEIWLQKPLQGWYQSYLSEWNSWW